MRPLDPSDYRDIVRRALEEDVRDGDITTLATVAPAQRARGVFLAKADCVVAGLDVALEAFRQVASTEQAAEPVVEAAKRDGDACRCGDAIAAVIGSARTLLLGERTALNFFQRLSGVAPRARPFVQAARGPITIPHKRQNTPTPRGLRKKTGPARGAPKPPARP